MVEQESICIRPMMMMRITMMMMMKLLLRLKNYWAVQWTRFGLDNCKCMPISSSDYFFKNDQCVTTRAVVMGSIKTFSCSCLPFNIIGDIKRKA